MIMGVSESLLAFHETKEARSVEAKYGVLSKGGKLVDETVNLRRMRWLGCMARRSNHHLPRQAMLISAKHRL